jgi:23S rRNA pseudouridine2605 synthase
MAEERLQKIVSRAGVASRRKAEQLMAEGRVSVNGEIVTELGSKADLDRDHVKVDGKLLRRPQQYTYLALNKPRGVVTTMSDPEGRQTVVDLLRGVKDRVYPVGRLDYNSEGLLLLTNDGDFSNRIMSKASGIEKVYVAKLNAFLLPDQEEQFRRGVPLHGKRTAPSHLKMIKRQASPWYEVRITEGRYHQVRDMFQHFGVLVEKLRRVKVGFLDLDLGPGEFRRLTPREVERFKKLLKMEEAS